MQNAVQIGPEFTNPRKRKTYRFDDEETDVLPPKGKGIFTLEYVWDAGGFLYPIGSCVIEDFPCVTTRAATRPGPCTDLESVRHMRWFAVPIALPPAEEEPCDCQNYWSQVLRRPLISVLCTLGVAGATASRTGNSVPVNTPLRAIPKPANIPSCTLPHGLTHYMAMI